MNYTIYRISNKQNQTIHIGSFAETSNCSLKSLKNAYLKKLNIVNRDDYDVRQIIFTEFDRWVDVLDCKDMCRSVFEYVDPYLNPAN